MEAVRIVTVSARPRFTSRSELEHAMTYSPALTDRDRANLAAKVRTGATCLIAEIDRALKHTRPAWTEHRSGGVIHAERREVEYSTHPGGRIIGVR